MSHRPATMDSVIFRRAQSLFSSFVVVDAGVPEDDDGAVVVDVDVRGGREDYCVGWSWASSSCDFGSACCAQWICRGEVGVVLILGWLLAMTLAPSNIGVDWQKVGDGVFEPLGH